MTALANSVKRIWSAKGRVPCLTGWGTPGSLNAALSVARVHEMILAFVDIFRRTAPTIVVVTLNIFR